MGSDLGAVDVAEPVGRRRMILDGCALLNLYASRRIAEILATAPRPTAVAEYVRDNEALWVGRHKSGPEADYEKVEIGPLVASGLVELLSLEGDDEMASFLTLASSSRIDDGEAISGAIAHARGLVVVTDDKAALRVFGRHSPPIPTCSTASLVKCWADRTSVDAVDLRRVLVNIRERACFEPGLRDPLFDWWREAIRAA